MLTKNEALGYCKTLLLHFAENLTEWEDGFVWDIKGKLERGGELTEKQAQALDNIMERCAHRHGR